MTTIHWRDGSVRAQAPRRLRPKPSKKSSRKYSEDQPRDERGRFGFSDTSVAAGTALNRGNDMASVPEKFAERVDVRLTSLDIGARNSTGSPEERFVEAWGHGDPNKIPDGAIERNLEAAFQAGTAKDAHWYYDLHNEFIAPCAEQYNVPGAFDCDPNTVAAVMALTSALADVQSNEAYTVGVLNAMAHPDEIVHVNDEAAQMFNDRNKGETVEAGDYRRGDLSARQLAALDPTIRCGKAGYDGQIKAIELCREPQATRLEAIDRIVAGPKQRNFTNNLSNPADPRSATIDTWMYRAAMGQTDRAIPGMHEMYLVPVAKTGERMSASEFEARSGGKLPKDDPRRIGVQGWNGLFQGTPSMKGVVNPNTGTYPKFATAVQRIAALHGIRPSEAQAQIWAGIGGGEKVVALQ